MTNLHPVLRPILLALVVLVELGCSRKQIVGCIKKPVDLEPVRPVENVPFSNKTTCKHEGNGADYAVGPGHKYATPGDVPFESLKAGDTVRIHYRPEPYKEKLMISGQGTEAQPIRVCGVPGPGGQAPVIDGEDASTRASLVFPFDGHQARGVVVVGWQGNKDWKAQPTHIVLEGLDIRGGKKGSRFKDKAGKDVDYPPNAAGVFLQRGTNVTLRNNVIHDNGNGLFLGTAGGDELTKHVLVEGNHIHENGYPDSDKEHNVYTEAVDVTYQYNRFGSPKRDDANVGGINIKDRSAGVTIRYNWIEDGVYLIDLCDVQETVSQNKDKPIEDEALLARYRETRIYGNVLIRGQRPGAAMVRYGGDSDMFERYRKGTLHFYNNTVLIENGPHPEWQGTSVFLLLTNDETLQTYNNVYYAEAASLPTRPVALLGSRDEFLRGQANFSGDWMKEDLVLFDSRRGREPKIEAKAHGFDELTRGKDPGFVDAKKRDLHLSAGAAAGTSGVKLPYDAKDLPAQQFEPSGEVKKREDGDKPTPGAYAVP